MNTSKLLIFSGVALWFPLASCGEGLIETDEPSEELNELEAEQGRSNDSFVFESAIVDENLHRNLCLDVAGGDAYDYPYVHVWGCHRGSNQRWTLHYQAVTGGFHHSGFQILSERESHHAVPECLTVLAGGDEHGNGARIGLRPCLPKAANQSFVFLEGQIRPMHLRLKCIDVKGGPHSAGNGTHVIQYGCDPEHSRLSPTLNQTWVRTSP